MREGEWYTDRRRKNQGGRDTRGIKVVLEGDLLPRLMFYQSFIYTTRADKPVCTL